MFLSCLRDFFQQRVKPEKLVLFVSTTCFLAHIGVKEELFFFYMLGETIISYIFTSFPLILSKWLISWISIQLPQSKFFPIHVTKCISADFLESSENSTSRRTIALFCSSLERLLKLQLKREIRIRSGTKGKIAIFENEGRSE